MLKSAAASQKSHATGTSTHSCRGSTGVTHAAPSADSKKRRDKVVYYLGLTKYSIVSKVCASFPNWVQCFDENDDWDLCWTDSAVSPERFSRMRPYQKINHFVGTSAISRKNYLARNLLRMKAYYPNEYKFFPHTWSLPAGRLGSTKHSKGKLSTAQKTKPRKHKRQLKHGGAIGKTPRTIAVLERLALHSDLAVFRSQFTGKRRKTFIIKPDASSQGRGIFLTRNVEDINPSEHLVAQRYIHRPFLIDGLKFDLRIYVLLSGCNPLRIFVHQDGLVRFATKAYAKPTTRNLGDKTMHLTNYAINKSSSNFEQNCDPGNASLGHKRSMFHVLDRLRKEGHDVDSLCRTIDECLCKTIIGIQPSLAHIYGSCKGEDLSNSMCFEILGIDIMIDHKLTPWLIEVNHSPSFTTDSELDSLVKFRVIRDALVLLDVSPEARRKYYAQQKVLAEQRRFSHCNQQTRDQRMHDRQQTIAELARRRTAWEDTHLGGWRRIYPTEDRVRRYSHLLEAAQEIWQCMTGMCKTKVILARILEERKEAPQKTDAGALSGNVENNRGFTGKGGATCISKSSNKSSKKQPTPAGVKPGVERRSTSMCVMTRRPALRPLESRRTCSTISNTSASSSTTVSTMCSTSTEANIAVFNTGGSPSWGQSGQKRTLVSDALRKSGEVKKGKDQGVCASAVGATPDTSSSERTKQNSPRAKDVACKSGTQTVLDYPRTDVSESVSQIEVQCSPPVTCSKTVQSGASGVVNAKEIKSHSSYCSSGLTAQESCPPRCHMESLKSRKGPNPTRPLLAARINTRCNDQKSRSGRPPGGSHSVQERKIPKQQATGTAVQPREQPTFQLKIVDVSSMCTLPAKPAKISAADTSG